MDRQQNTHASDRTHISAMSDVSDEDIGPDESYGRANPSVVFDVVEGKAWYWSSRNTDAYITYEGDLVEIER